MALRTNNSASVCTIWNIPARSVPFPGGDIRYPSPHIAMGLGGIDAYHLSPDGFTVLAEFYVRKFISNYLRRNKDTTIHSLGQNFDGWVDEGTNTGTGNVLIGKNNQQLATKGIFSFNTAVIPANKKVKKAVLFFKKKKQLQDLTVRLQDSRKILYWILKTAPSEMMSSKAVTISLRPALRMWHALPAV